MPHWWTRTRVKQLTVVLSSFVWNAWGGGYWFPVSRAEQPPLGSALLQWSSLVWGNTHHQWSARQFSLSLSLPPTPIYIEAVCSASKLPTVHVVQPMLPCSLPQWLGPPLPWLSAAWTRRDCGHSVRAKAWYCRDVQLKSTSSTSH